jgi:hypothetical protein
VPPSAAPAGASSGGWQAGGPPSAPRIGWVLPLRPMTVADILDGAFQVLRRIFVPALILLLVLVAPVQALSNLLLQVLGPGTQAFDPFAVDPIVDAGTPVTDGQLAALFGFGTLLGIVSFVVNIITGAAVVALALQADRGEKPDALRAVRNTLARFWAITGATLLLLLGGGAAVVGVVLVGVLLAFLGPVGFVLLVVLVVPLGIAGVLLWAALSSLVIPVAVVERAGPIRTLARVIWVLRERFWRVIGITALVAIVLIAATLGLGVVAQIVALLAGPFAWILQTIGDLVVSAVVVPVTGVAALLVYLDTRIRREGLDLHVRAGRVAPW